MLLHAEIPHGGFGVIFQSSCEEKSTPGEGLRALSAEAAWIFSKTPERRAGERRCFVTWKNLLVGGLRGSGGAGLEKHHPR